MQGARAWAAGPNYGQGPGLNIRLGLPWAPASRRILAAMNPRQRRGILLLTLSALGLLGVFVLVAGYVADVRAEVDPKVTVLALAKPAEKDKAITDDMVKTIELPRRWAPQTALRDRARLIGQVAQSRPPRRERPAGGHDRRAPRAGHGRARDRDPRRRRDRRRRQDQPGLDRRHRRHLRGRRPAGRQGRVQRRRARRAHHRRRPARAQGRQRRPGPGRRPGAGRPGHLRAEAEGGADGHLRRVLRRRGPPGAAATRRGVRAEGHASASTAVPWKASEPAAADRRRRRRPRGRGGRAGVRERRARGRRARLGARGAGARAAPARRRRRRAARRARHRAGDGRRARDRGELPRGRDGADRRRPTAGADAHRDAGRHPRRRRAAALARAARVQRARRRPVVARAARARLRRGDGRRRARAAS